MRVWYFIIVFGLASCFMTKQNIQESSESSLGLKREWMLVEFKNFTKSYLIEHKAKLDLTNKNQANAMMGCNALTFPYEMNHNKLKFRGGIMTQMSCEDMSLENQFAESIVKVNDYKIEGHSLTLTTLSGETLKFIASDWD